MAEFGIITLYAMLLATAWSTALALVGVAGSRQALVDAARKSMAASALLSTVALVTLTHAFAVSDFAIQYVQQYSDRSMPLFYRLTAVWGGQQGSLLFWAWLLAVLGAWAVQLNHRILRREIPWVIVVLNLSLIFFVAMLLLQAQPFVDFMFETPTAGKGLNPLLQNAYMVTHPPALYVGYVGMAVPFAFAMAALITGRVRGGWATAARPFALGSWYFLALGLVLGMLWAYEELGWGGYWGWDPVENAGLIPWFTCTALVHSLLVKNRRGTFVVWSLVLAVLSFELTIFGTFLTRSGFIESVHAFARSSIGWYFLAFMGLVLLLSLALLIARRKLLTGHDEGHQAVSREGFFSVANWVFLGAAALVLVLTIFPNISQVFGDKIKISPQAFNRWMMPLGLTLLALTAVGPMLPWRKVTLSRLARLMTAPFVLALAVMVAMVVRGARSPAAVVTVGLSALALALTVQELVRGVRACRARMGGGVVGALAILVRRNARRHGALLVHAGVVLMYIGFAGEAFKQEKQISLSRGGRAVVGDYTLRFDGAKVESDPRKQSLTARLSLYLDGQRVGVLEPARWLFHKYPNEPTSEVAIRRSLSEDLFVALGDHDAARQAATFKVVINPLVNWIWIGFLLLTLGSLVTLVPPRKVRRADRAATLSPGDPSTAEVGS